jgi:hypothetical protein
MHVSFHSARATHQWLILNQVSLLCSFLRQVSFITVHIALWPMACVCSVAN